MPTSWLYVWRRGLNLVLLSLSGLAMVAGVSALAWILWTLAEKGVTGMAVKVFTESTPPPGSDGGLLNAITGSLMLVVTGIAIGAPLGVLAGTYLAEFGRHSRMATVMRFLNDVLLSAPSIIIGLFVYDLVVARQKHFSGWAGAFALALIAIPVVVGTTETMLQLVPASLREAAAALGAPRWKVVTAIAYRAARPGIITGILLAIARMSGETAPLLFTALNNQFWGRMSTALANLPVVIFQFAMSPYEDWKHLAWAGSLLITVGVLGLNVLARFLFRPQQGVH